MARIPATTGRVVIEAVSPQVDGGRFAAKRLVGDQVVVEADVFCDGHDAIGAVLRTRQVGSRRWVETRMAPIGNDRWRADFIPNALGIWQYEVEGWADHFATWLDGFEKKVAAEVGVSVDLLIGADLVSEASMRTKGKPARLLKKYSATLADTSLELTERLEAAFSEELKAVMDDHPDRSRATRSERRYEVMVDRETAGFSTWYELFPRSWAVQPEKHGTFVDLAKQLGYVADMGFDVLYLPPIHPIGTTDRKGPNNTIRPSPDDPGVPWAIGSDQGGHTAIATELGTIEDFRVLRDTALERGLELALDVAFQCSPDHPWVKEHPEWFRSRPDGSVQYAENPPKKYQDIYPLDFDTPDRRGLWLALKGVFDHWIGEGIRIFRVDNPHTKAFSFWEWVIAEIRREYPDVIFLAEAFTRPRVMERLAKIGFNQSYTYFAWRQSSWELRQYFEDLSTRTVDYFRPNAWPNTPDILTEQLQSGSRAMFATRAALAATLSPSWGIYGPAFELGEHLPVRPGSEEYLDSEKYQLRQWDLDQPDTLAPFLTRLNQIRRAQPALAHLRTLRFHSVPNPALLCYSKTDPAGVGRPVLVVANLDTDQRQQGHVDIDLQPLGLPYESTYVVADQLTGATFRWQGAWNFVDLDPAVTPMHIFEVRPA